ncbi:MAG TPA: aminoacyl-tRNA hydrolase [Candidatus Dojkabacteria bacterium]|jgi:PTH1 family peptidyl-tRNA hydrolase
MLVQNNEQENFNFHVDDNKFLIIGLGNVGKDYENTRHNAGFLYLDMMQKKESAPDFREDKKLHALITSFKKKGNKYFLAKPTTYMNASGDSVKAIMKYYDIQISNLTIVHDDLDIELGKVKESFGKGPKEHNGIASVERSLGTSQFKRVRIGIESRTQEERKKWKGKDFVLGRFGKDEMEKIKNFF